jgi:hypothetical protein
MWTANAKVRAKSTAEEGGSDDWQLDCAEGGAAYAVVVAWRAVPKLSCGSLEPTPKGAENPSLPTVSKQAVLGRSSPVTPGDVARSVGDMPSVTTFPKSQMEKKIFPPGERRNKTSKYVLGLKTCKFLDGNCANYLRKLMVRMNEFLVLVPDNANSVLAIVDSLWSLGESVGRSFGTFSFPEDGYLRLVVNVRMPYPTVMSVSFWRLYLSVCKLLTQLRSRCPNQDGRTDRTVTPHRIVSVSHLLRALWVAREGADVEHAEAASVIASGMLG